MDNLLFPIKLTQRLLDTKKYVIQAIFFITEMFPIYVFAI